MSEAVPALTALLARRHPETIRLGLTPVRRLLSRLGNPQRALTVVHVAGTNGKGSVIAFLEAICLAAGIPVAAFTSPHLARFNERIRINRVEISDEALESVLSQTLALDPNEETTFFELTTAAALLHLARLKPFGRPERRGGQPPGIVLLETGLGGRLDATNVVKPRLSVITALGVDHADYLGHSLAGIAREKAGILKPGVAAVAAPGGGEPDRVVTGVANRLRVALALAGREFGFAAPSGPEAVNGSWRFRDREGRLFLPAPSLPGRHQYANAALAVAAARMLGRLGYPMPAAALRAGVAQAVWPGRLEYFPGVPPVWLDGAHNPQAVWALVRFLRERNAQDASADGASRPTALVFSVLNNKDGAAMARQLATVVQRVFTVPCGGSRGRTPQELIDLWRGLAPGVTACADTRQALDAARRAVTPGGRVVVAGSLFLVGEARSLLC
ncbi:MAG: bifunctional folylpolyglutamate synthase/dihydrofolate synthase [Magnetococcales bacterium]|nr:bifunctional folylpolyglutamate synthase/dihydrofolate synthase [Magnetococcales bacterium]